VAVVAMWAVAYFLLLVAAVFWSGTAWKVWKAHAADVRLVHVVLGVLLVCVAAGLILHAPLLLVACFAVIALGLRDVHVRTALVRWWDEVREAGTQRSWSIEANEGRELGLGVRYSFAAPAAMCISEVSAASG
jgi:hypothetical protein